MIKLSKRTIIECDECMRVIEDKFYCTILYDFCSEECAETYFLREKEQEEELEAHIKKQNEVSSQC